MTLFVQSTPTFDDLVWNCCFKDAAIVEKIRRRRRHKDHEIYRDFVILPDDVSDSQLPKDLFTRTRLRSHLRADSDRLVSIEGNEVLLGQELRSLRDSLEIRGLKLSQIVPMRYTYIRDGVEFNYLVIRISRPY